MELNDAKKYAYHICLKNDVLDPFDRIYPFTTENISGYFKEKDIKDKSVLTVGSSTDQALNTFMMGAKDVTIFDVNPFTKYYFELKKSAIINLNINEFLEFICYLNYPKSHFKNNNSLNEETYKKISENLSKESLYFWNYLFDTFKYRFIRQRLFTDDEYSFKYIKKFNNYLNEQNYKLLKEKIINFNPDFITSNLISLPKHLNKTYDTIYLSNISHYLEEYNFSLNQFRKNILELLNYLNTNGTIYIAYLYDMKETTKPLYYWDPIYQIPLLRKIFKDENFNMESFIGVQGIINDDENHKDSVLSLKK